MRSNIVTRTAVGYETEEGDLLVIRYLTRYNRYYMYRCPLSGERINYGECVRTEPAYICYTLRVRYCVHSSSSSNVYVEAKVCQPVWEYDLNNMLSGCPRRNYIRIPWDLLRRRTRREVITECRRWWREFGYEDVNDYLDEIAQESARQVYEWVNTCFTMTEPFLDLLSDYVDEFESVAWRDETILRWCRCTPEGRLTNCVRSTRWLTC